MAIYPPTVFYPYSALMEMQRLFEMGQKAYHSTDYDEAIRLWGKGLRTAKKSKYKQGTGAFLGNIGMVYDDLGQYNKALSYYQQALAINRETGGRRGEGNNLTNMGLVYQNLNQYDKAVRSFLESLKICEEVGAPESLWRAHRGLASVETRLNRGDKAVVHYEQALNTIETMREELIENEAKTGLSVLQRGETMLVYGVPKPLSYKMGVQPPHCVDSKVS